jgi:hypothetical protein
MWPLEPSTCRKVTATAPCAGRPTENRQSSQWAALAELDEARDVGAVELGPGTFEPGVQLLRS